MDSETTGRRAALICVLNPNNAINNPATEHSGLEQHVKPHSLLGECGSSVLVPPFHMPPSDKALRTYEPRERHTTIMLVVNPLASVINRLKYACLSTIFSCKLFLSFLCT